jgi:hypothetical protein
MGVSRGSGYVNMRAVDRDDVTLTAASCETTRRQVRVRMQPSQARRSIFLRNVRQMNKVLLGARESLNRLNTVVAHRICGQKKLSARLVTALFYTGLTGDDPLQIPFHLPVPSTQWDRPPLF